MLQLQKLGLVATVTNTLDHEGEPQEFAEASKPEACMDSKREELSSLIYNQTWTVGNLPPGRQAIRCGWMYKAKKNEYGAVFRFKSLALWQKDIARNQTSTITTLSRLLETE